MQTVTAGTGGNGERPRHCWWRVLPQLVHNLCCRWPIAEPFGRSRAPSDGFPSFALISPFFAQALLTCWRRPANILRAPLVCKGSKGFLVVPSFLSPPTQRHGRLGFRIWYRLPNRK